MSFVQFPLNEFLEYNNIKLVYIIEKLINLYTIFMKLISITIIKIPFDIQEKVNIDSRKITSALSQSIFLQ